MKQLLLLITILIAGSDTKACTCNDIMTAEASKLIFKGKVISFEHKEIHVKGKEHPLYHTEVRFKITKAIKGKMNKEIVINVPSLSDADCGIPFKTGDVYEVYAFLEDELLYTNICTQTHKVK